MAIAAPGMSIARNSQPILYSPLITVARKPTTSAAARPIGGRKDGRRKLQHRADEEPGADRKEFGHV